MVLFDGEKNSFEIALDRFREHRKKIRKPCTDHALDLIRKKALELGRDADGAISHIEYAIEKGWSGIYPMKEKPDNKHPLGEYRPYVMTAEDMKHLYE